MNKKILFSHGDYTWVKSIRYFDINTFLVKSCYNNCIETCICAQDK